MGSGHELSVVSSAESPIVAVAPLPPQIVGDIAYRSPKNVITQQPNDSPEQPRSPHAWYVAGNAWLTALPCGGTIPLPPLIGGRNSVRFQ